MVSFCWNFLVLQQSVPLRDTTLCSKHFLSVFEFVTKVLLTIWQFVRMPQTDFWLCRSGIHTLLANKHEWSTCGPVVKRFLAVYWLKKYFFSKLKAWMIGALGERSPCVLDFCILSANNQFQVIRGTGLQAQLVYKREWSTCRTVVTRFLAVYWLKIFFLSKVKGLNDRGIRQTFPIMLWFCLNMRFKGRAPLVYITRMVYM